MKFTWKFLLVTFFFAWPVCCFAAGTGTPANMLILPFDVHSDKDMTFLKDAIQSMLVTRLTQGETSQPVSRETTDQAVRGISRFTEKNALEIARKVGADYVVGGSVSFIGQNLSTDAWVLNTKDGKRAVTFSEVGKDQGEVIGHIDRFSAAVNDKLFGRKSEPAKPSEAGSRPETDTSRQHPEKLWTGKIEAGDKNASSETQETKEGLSGWRSRNFEIEILSLALGDVDGDRNTELVFMDETSIHVYRFSKERLIRLAEVPAMANSSFIALDVADVNQNGKSEVFVTATAQPSGSLSSFVLEWDGANFQKIVNYAANYFRVIHTPGKTPVLLGQNAGFGELFSGSVEELKWQNGEYVSSNSYSLPLWVNLFGLNMADLAKNNKIMTVVFTERDYIRVLDSEGRVEWESPEEFAGGTQYLEVQDPSSASIGDYKEKRRRYLPQRILIADTDQNGRYEVIVGKKTDQTRGLFEKMRIYKGGHIEALEWGEFGLSTQWKTREISGNLSDYAIGDIDNDGREEVVYSVIQEVRTILGAARSYVVVQKIEAALKKKP